MSSRLEFAHALKEFEGLGVEFVGAVIVPCHFIRTEVTGDGVAFEFVQFETAALIEIQALQGLWRV